MADIGAGTRTTNSNIRTYRHMALCKDICARTSLSVRDRQYRVDYMAEDKHQWPSVQHYERKNSLVKTAIAVIGPFCHLVLYFADKVTSHLDIFSTSTISAIENFKTKCQAVVSDPWHQKARNFT